MTDQYKEYLATNVLNESKIVTYRTLSRALKVHVNVAKQMLFDFYHKQNAKNSKSVHATYLVTGKRLPKPSTQTNGIHSQDGEDSFMRSSPFMSSMPEAGSASDDVEEPIPITSVILVREEEIEDTITEFLDVTSIHVYSLEPGPIENMSILSLCNQEIIKKYARDDPMERWKAYGGIQNPHIKRRSTKYAPPSIATVPPAPTAKPVAPSTATAQTKETETAPAKARRGSDSKGNPSAGSTPQPESKTSTIKKADPKPTLKRGKSDIFKSFAKAKAKPKKPEAEESQEATPAPEDEEMQGMSEDEEEQDYSPEVEVSKEKAEESRQARKQREEDLRKMMDEEDEDTEMNDAPAGAEESQDAPLDSQASDKTQEPEPTVTVTDGRRRGRRRVPKKKTVKDEEGYLVTREELVWESFSEDEPVAKKSKIQASKPASAAKGKKGATNKQGSIASFFAKK